MDNTDWVKLCSISIDFVKFSTIPNHYNISNAIKALENLKIKETVQWEKFQGSSDRASKDLHSTNLIRRNNGGNT